MGGLAQTPLPTVQNDVDMFWPDDINTWPIGTALPGQFCIRYSGLPAAVGLSAKIGGGVGNCNVSPDGAWIGQVASSPLGQGARYLAQSFSIRLQQTAGAAAALGRSTAFMRVTRWQFVVQLQAAVAAVNPLGTYFVFGPELEGDPQGAGNCYAGIFLGVDARWKYASRISAGGFGLSEGFLDLGWPASTRPMVVDFLWLSATDAVDAQFQIFLNQQYQTPVIARSWGAGTKLPIYPSNGNVNASRFYPSFAAADLGVVVVLQLREQRYSRGQFLPNGTQVF